MRDRRPNPIKTLAAAFFVVAALFGCEQGVHEETRLFQEAEALYRAGDYDGATERYQAFLTAYPRSPFARTAKLRERTIEREMESVMGTRGTNRPVYIRPTGDEAAAIIEREVAAPERERERQLEAAARAPSAPGSTAKDDLLAPVRNIEEIVEPKLREIMDK